jgi:hypothetical protein
MKWFLPMRGPMRIITNENALNQFFDVGADRIIMTDGHLIHKKGFEKPNQLAKAFFLKHIDQFQHICMEYRQDILNDLKGDVILINNSEEADTFFYNLCPKCYFQLIPHDLNPRLWYCPNCAWERMIGVKIR